LDAAIGSTAARRGCEQLATGYSVSQVVHEYGEVCQAITELAVERKTAISPEELHTLSRCVDTAIVEAVTEHARGQGETATHEVARLGQVTLELRDQLHTALLSLDVLKTGRAGVTGKTGAALGRSLLGSSDLIESTPVEVCLATSAPPPVRLSMLVFLDEIAVTARVHAEQRGKRLKIEPVDPALHIEVDRQRLASALMNLLQNAFKYSREHGRVTLRSHRDGDRVLIEVEDECGGLETNESAPTHSLGDRRRSDRSGHELGICIARKSVRAIGGEVRTRNIPCQGCVFSIDLPAASGESANSQSLRVQSRHG
jgi:signal transduction histidine kinase